MIRPIEHEAILLTKNSDDEKPTSSCFGIFNKAFCGIYLQDESSTALVILSPLMDIMPEFTVSLNGVHKVIDSLKLFAPSGVDEIDSRVLKGTKYTSRYCLLNIFNQALSTGNVLKDWRREKVIPICKKDSRLSTPLAPITLISSPCKPLKQLVFKNLLNFLQSYSFFFALPHDLVSGCSRTTQLASFVHAVFCAAFFLDLKKAFHKIPH